MTAAGIPDAIELSPGVLRLRWPNEPPVVLDAATLRHACRCADCRAAERRGAPLAVPPALSLAGAEPVGLYGLQLRFSDGHDRGIYPWRYLAEQAGEPASA